MVPSLPNPFRPQGPRPLVLSSARLFLAIAAFLAGVVGVQLLGMFAPFGPDRIWVSLAVYLAMMAWAVLVLRVWLQGVTEIGIAAMLGVTAFRLDLKQLIRVIIGFAFLAGCFVALSIVLFELDWAPDLSPLHRQYRVWLDQSTRRIVLIVMATVLAPLFEEFFFRGFVLRALLHSHSTALALILSALLFALLHPLAALPISFSLGLCLGMVYLWFGDIWTNVIVHALWNALALALIGSGIW